jgi:polar amino acid transport system substrate-binding protein
MKNYLLYNFGESVGLYVIQRLLFLASIILLIFVSCSPRSEQTVSSLLSKESVDNNIINLHYNERPPYLVTTETGVGGLTGDPTTIVFEKSNLAFQWVQTPSKRQIYILQQNSGRDCLPGWFKTGEREAFAKYTLPIYQDKPQIALARADNDKIPFVATVGEVLSKPQLTLLVKDGYSYGSFLDQKITELNPARLETTVENSGMLKMVYAGHADYFLIAPEEAEGLIKTSEFDLQDFKTVHFTDIPDGEQRFILCSLQVDDSIIEQLNMAIRQNVVISTE